MYLDDGAHNVGDKSLSSVHFEIGYRQAMNCKAGYILTIKNSLMSMIRPLHCITRHRKSFTF